MDKEMFRLVLLGIGVAIVAAVFAWDRFRARRRGASTTKKRPRPPRVEASRRRAEPRLEGTAGEELDDLEDDLDLIARVIGSEDHFDISEPRVVARRGPEPAEAPGRPEPRQPSPTPPPARRHVTRTAAEPAGDPDDILLEDLPGTTPVRERAAEERGDTPPPRNSAAAAPPAQDEVPARVIALSLMARHGTISGIRLRKAFDEQQLSFGPMSIYHCRRGEETLFSVANLVAPGTFDPTTLDAFKSPGLALFMTVPGPRDPVAAFDAMQTTAEALARRLDSELCDTRRRPLDGIGMDALRAEARRSPER